MKERCAGRFNAAPIIPLSLPGFCHLPPVVWFSRMKVCVVDYKGPSARLMSGGVYHRRGSRRGAFILTLSLGT